MVLLVIVAAEDLAPSDTVQMPLDRVAGLITARGSTTAHAARAGASTSTGDSANRILFERIGMIKFGSRVDVFVAPEVALRVKVGDHVKAGSTIIGASKPSES